MKHQSLLPPDLPAAFWAPIFCCAALLSLGCRANKPDWVAAYETSRPAIALGRAATPPVATAVNDTASPGALPDSTHPIRTVAHSEISGDDAGEYELQAFEDLALAQHAGLAERQAQIEALQGKWLQAGLPPNPELGFSGQQLFDGQEVEQVGLYFGQQWVRQEKLDWSQSIVCREIDAAQHELDAERLRVLTDVRLAFYALLVAQQRLQVTGELVELAEANLRTVESLRGAGESARVDVLRAQVEVQTSRLRLQNAEHDRLAAWSRLAALVGIPSEPAARVTGELQPPSLELDRSELLRRLLSDSPEVMAALAEQQRAHDALHRATVEPLPDVTVQAVVQHDNSTGNANSNLQISMPLPWRDRNQGGIRQARGEAASAMWAVERQEQQLRARFATVYRRYANAAQQVRDYSAEEGILANARSTIDIMQQAFSAGEVGFLDLLTAQRAYSETQLQYLEAMGDLLASYVEIDGMLLSGSLEAPQ